MKDEQTASMFSKVSTEGNASHQILAMRLLLHMETVLPKLTYQPHHIFRCLAENACMQQQGTESDHIANWVTLAPRASSSCMQTRLASQNACLVAGINFDAYEEVQVWHLHACVFDPLSSLLS